MDHFSDTQVAIIADQWNGDRIASPFAKSSSATSLSAADAFSVTCLGSVAPIIAEDTSGRRSTQASANCDRERPASSATRFTFCTASSVEGSSQCFGSMAPIVACVALEPPGNGALGRYLPVRTPCASG